MREILKASYKCMGLLLLLTILGYTLVVVSYAVPETNIISNASDSTDFLVTKYIEKDTVWMNWPDYFTDVVMLNIASYDSGEDTILYKAIANEKIGDTFEIVGWLSSRAPLKKQFYVFEEEGANYSVTNYGKYWNGYLVFLKPLLYFYNMSQIYHIFWIIMIASFLAATVVLLIHNVTFAIPFVCAFLTLRPFSKFCLTYAIINILICAFMIWSVVSRKINMFKVNRLVFFFVAGAVASYITLMNYSFVIAVFCAVYLAYTIPVDEEKNTSRAKELILMLLFYTAGYVAMWAAKWVIIMLFDRSLLVDVIESIKIRLSHEDNGTKVTYREAIVWNACGFFYKSNGLFLSFFFAVLEAIVLIVEISFTRISKERLHLTEVITTAVAAIGSILVRYAVVLNHSRVHYFFMNRLMSGAVFVILSCGMIWISVILRQKKQQKSANA